MLIFAKDIGERDHKHAREADNQALHEYMEYQRKLFPYTIIRPISRIGTASSFPGPDRSWKWRTCTLYWSC